MPKLRLREQNFPSTTSARDASPDSVIFPLESNFSLFSSASASVDRCSFASDAQDRDSIASDISLHLAGNDDEPHDVSSAPGPDPNKSTLHSLNKHIKGYKMKVQKEDSTDDDLAIVSARSSFSLALKECQDRRSRLESLKKLERRRPASLDLNNAAVSSPRLASIKKTSLNSLKTSTLPSPGTPNYRHASIAMHKGWTAERVPLRTSAGRNYPGAALLPLNNGRMLPSKWEDAERWICSPVSGDGVVRHSLQQPQRRPKSKSGPLGPPGVAYHSLYSPVVPMFEGGNVGNFMFASPFPAGVAADRLDIRPGGHAACMARSASVHGCFKVQKQETFFVTGDERPSELVDAATNISGAVPRRDMATQMSPDGSTHSSPKAGPSFVDLTSILPTVGLQNTNSSKSEERDVQVDEQITMTRWSKKHKARIPGKSSEIIDSWKKKNADIRTPAWDLSDTTKSISKEEARISAWENLQKAKAEAAIRKLEMKLEKKRSSSMYKIINKLRSAQKRAQEMRSSVLDNQAHKVSRTSRKAILFHKTLRIGSLSGCFTCRAF